VTTLAGLAQLDVNGVPVSGSADGTGSAARFASPSGVAVDSAGNVYVADTGNNEVRRVGPAGAGTRVAGLGNERDTEGNREAGGGSAARFGRATGVGVDSAGNVYVADAGNNTMLKVPPAGVVTTLAGGGDGGSADGTGSAAGFASPSGVAVDSAGNVYVADSD